MNLPLDSLAAARWTPDRAHAWCAAAPWQLGANFAPATAGNQLEMWQADTFDPATIARELGWAAAIGCTSMRIFLHDLCYAADPTGFLMRVDRVLGLAAERGIRCLLVFFDSCWHPVPRLGRQRGPEPGVHNSMWVQSPGVPVLRDPAAFARLEGYVQAVIGRFRDDPRIIGWDLWNEPCNANANSRGPRDLGAAKDGIVAPLLAQVFAWARAAHPSQPLTSGLWCGRWATGELNQVHQVQVAASDVISFHVYADAAGTANRITEATSVAAGRPLWCTEFMARGCGSTFAAALPLFAAQRIGAWCWGLVDGRTQTKYAWKTWQEPCEGEPPLWFHEIFHRDGRPYRDDEVALIRELARATR